MKLETAKGDTLDIHHTLSGIKIKRNGIPIDIANLKKDELLELEYEFRKDPEISALVKMCIGLGGLNEME